MRKTSLSAVKQNISLKEAFSAENKKLKYLSEAEIDKALKPENYLGETEKIIDKVIKRLER